MSNDTEKPNLEKDHKEFLKMKEQQINNKDEFVSDNDPIGKEMKNAGEKPDRESIKKDGAQESFSGREGFVGKPNNSFIALRVSSGKYSP